MGHYPQINSIKISRDKSTECLDSPDFYEKLPLTSCLDVLFSTDSGGTHGSDSITWPFQLTCVVKPCLGRGDVICVGTTSDERKINNSALERIFFFTRFNSFVCNLLLIPLKESKKISMHTHTKIMSIRNLNSE